MPDAGSIDVTWTWYTVERCPVCWWPFQKPRTEAQKDRMLCRACESKHEQKP